MEGAWQRRGEGPGQVREYLACVYVHFFTWMMFAGIMEEAGGEEEGEEGMEDGTETEGIGEGERGARRVMVVGMRAVIEEEIGTGEARVVGTEVVMETVKGVDTEEVVMETVKGVDTEEVMMEMVKGVDTEEVVMETVKGVDTEEVVMETVKGVDTEEVVRVGTEGEDKVTIGTVRGGATLKGLNLRMYEYCYKLHHTHFYQLACETVIYLISNSIITDASN